MHTLNLSRVALLLRRQALLHGRSTFIWLAPALLVLMLSAYLSGGGGTSDNGDVPFFALWYGLLVGVGGFFVACHTLREHRTADGRQASLTLPASDTEKFAAAYLWSGPIFLVVFTLVFWVVSLLSNGLLNGIGAVGYAPFDVFSEASWWAVSFYLLIVHPIGFLGAIAFDTKVAPKTTGVLLAVILALGLIAALTFRIAFADAFDGFFAPGDNRVEFRGSNPFAIDPVWGFGHLLETLFALLLLTAAYFRFHEKEV